MKNQNKQREERELGERDKEKEKGEIRKERRRRKRRKMETNDIIRQKGSGPHVHVTLCHQSYLSRFLCSAVEDFVVDIVKAWSRIKQNNTAIESVILKVSFHPFVLYSLWQEPHFLIKANVPLTRKR